MRVDLPIWARLTICVVKALTYVYEFFTRPYYYITVNPMKVRRQLRSIRARPMVDGDSTSPYRCVESPDSLSTTLFPGCTTLDDMLYRAVKLWPQQDILGTRELLREENELQPNGRNFIKQILGDYHWETYSQIDARVDAVGRGLIAIGVPSRSNVLIFSETRAEWMIVAQTCFRYNMPLVTLYPTLGEEGIMHGIKEAEVSCIITSEVLLPKLVKLLPKLPSIKHVVYLNHGIFGGNGRTRTDSQRSIDASELDAGNVQLHSLTGVERVGKRKEHFVDPRSEAIKPQANDLAVIMYTSGSTGLPKGVEITHLNLMAALSGQFPRIPVRPDDVYIGYLPLAHVLELACEVGCLSNGIRIGYSSPLTLFDNASKIKKGTLGDASVLQPTLMTAVPVILDRIYKAVWEKVIEGGPMSKALFKWAYQYKLNRLHRGYPSPMLDQLVFHKIRALLGGRIRMMVSGGAPLSPESQNFINIVFCPIAQGYGLTETCGGGTVMEMGDLHMHNVGAPMRCNEICLREWVEGRYSPMDKPNPRGEVLIGGGNVARGYYKQPEKTSEDFYTDKNGRRWFCTGDIGRFNDDGTLSIIDRKKDLVKLQGGEYVSLGKVEMALIACPFVESVCVYGESSKNHTVCLVVPKQKQLLKLAEELFKPEQPFVEADVAKLCTDDKLKAACLKQLQAAAAERRLERFEVPQAVCLLKDAWTPDNGLVTAAFKLKRREIQERFQKELNDMYSAKSRL